MYKVLIIGLLVLLAGCSKDLGDYPVSQASYADVQQAVGCGSDGDAASTEGLWNEKYRHHWMMWQGEITDVSGVVVKVNADYQGTDDLQVTLAVAADADRLSRGDFVVVTFLMQERGGCSLAYVGSNAAVEPMAKP